VTMHDDKQTFCFQSLLKKFVHFNPKKICIWHW